MEVGGRRGGAPGCPHLPVILQATLVTEAEGGDGDGDPEDPGDLGDGDPGDPDTPVSFDDSEDFYFEDSSCSLGCSMDLEYQYEPSISLASLTSVSCSCSCHGESGEPRNIVGVKGHPSKHPVVYSLEQMPN